MRMHKKKRKTKIVWSIATVLFAALTGASMIGASIANENSAAINSYFDVLPYRLETVDEDEVDSEYYKSSFVSQNGNYDDEALYDYDLRVSQQVTSEGSVLLWNNSNALPLAEGASVSFFSNTSVNAVYTGTGSGTINTSNAVNFKEAFEQYGFKVNDKLWDFYATGEGSSKNGYGVTQYGSAGIDSSKVLNVKEVPWSVIDGNAEVRNSFSSFNDAAIFVVGRSGGEGGDLAYNSESSGNPAGASPDTINNNYLQLSQTEINVLDNLINLKHAGVFEHVVLVLNSANAMMMDKISTYSKSIDACMWIGQPGAGGMPGVAKLFCGKSNPSGHLVDTYVYDNGSAPAMVNFYRTQYSNYSSFGVNESWQNAYTVYQEGIYIGYKYYETRYEDVVLGTSGVGDYDYTKTVTYPFGYGTSYTTFEYSNYSVNKDAKTGDYTVSVKVMNTGSVAGREVAQIYLQKPYTGYDIEKGIEKSAVELVGYAKTGVLEPGQEETLTVTVDDQDFKSYDAYGYGTYIREKGTYYLAVGNNAHDALNNILAAKKKNGIDSVNTSLMVDVNGKQTDGNSQLAKDITFDSDDIETYSVSVHTGVDIENQFDFVDINKCDYVGNNSVVYLSRNNWVGTYPVAAPKLTLTQEMANTLASKRDLAPTEEDAEAFYAEYNKDATTEEEKYEMTYGANNGLQLIEMLGRDYNDPAWDLLLDQMTWQEQAELCSNGYHTTAAVASVGKPATRDENGPLGITTTFSTMAARGGMGWPCEPIRAATFNTALNELMGRMVGEDMLHAGVNGLWGYGLNIHRTAYSGRNFEYYSEDSFLSGETCAYETLGTQSRGAFIMVKHFAANDSETNRHGVNEWMTEQTLREIYLSPFETEFTEGKAWATMTSYNRIGCEWAGGSYNLLTEVLRGEWGFKGYCSSDYAGKHREGDYAYYQNVYTGIQAGCDTYDANYHYDEYLPVEGDPIFNYCLRISSKRIMYAILHTAAMNGITSSTRVVPCNTWWQNALIGLQLVCAILTVFCLIGLIVSIINGKKETKKGKKNANGKKVKARR